MWATANESHPAATGKRVQGKRPAYSKHTDAGKKSYWVKEVKPSKMAEAANSLIPEYMLLLSYEYSTLN